MGMDTRKRANRILLEAEAELRKLIAEAAQLGDYSAVEAITGWASSLNSMLECVSNTRPGADSHAVPKNDGTDQPASRAKAKRKARKVSPRRKGKLKGYPKFARSGDTLVKIAWSKAQKSEYKHKSPRAVLSALTNSLSRLLGDNSIVAMDSVLPLRAEDGTEIPDYQVYLCLAWFRSIGAVEQRGRQGYTRNGLEADLSEVVRTEWDSLPPEDV